MTVQQRKTNTTKSTITNTQSASTTTQKEQEKVVYRQATHQLSIQTLNNLFIVFALVNFLSAYLNPISDCDESYNYWEPAHLLLYGSGFQTWEYSPTYALRSYLYVGIHATIGKVAMILGFNKIHVFYSVRAVLGLFSAFCQMWFMKGVSERFGRRITMYTFVFLIFASGMFNAVAAYGTWFLDVRTVPEKLFKYSLCIISAGSAVILGWPFCVVCVLPVALDTIIYYGIGKSIQGAIKTSMILLGLTVYVDRFFYKRFFITPLHLVMYNKGSGSQLYGVEPWTFYFKNMILNFNLIFLLSLLMPLVIVIHYIVFRKSKLGSDPAYFTTHWRYIVYVSPFHIWFAFFTSLPHKEERFLFVVYPLCCLSGAICLDYGLQIVDYVLYGSSMIKNVSAARSIDVNTLPEPSVKRGIFTNLIALSLIFVVVLLGVSRTVSVVMNYRAPLDVYAQLSDHIAQNEPVNKPINICVGKEWYRFPSSFFLPRDNVDLKFLRSDFRGLLPKPFQRGPDATSAIPTTMNDENREEMDRYVDIDQCDYLVDLDLIDQKEEHFLEDRDNWTVVSEEAFLDASKTPTLARAFYIPVYSEENIVYGHYVALKRNKKSKTTK